MSNTLIPTRVVRKDGIATTVHKRADGDGSNGTLNAAHPTLVGGGIDRLQRIIKNRTSAPKFLAMLKRRDELRLETASLKEQIRAAKDAGDKILARKLGRQNLVLNEEMIITNHRLGEYKDDTAPLVVALEELRTERDKANGSYNEYIGDTLGTARKVASFPSGSREWLEARQSGIGGSDVGAIMKVGKPEWRQANYDRVYISKTQPISDEMVAAQAANNSEYTGAFGRGNAWEEAIFREFAENHPELLVKHNKDSWVAEHSSVHSANIDGLICDLDGTPSGILEIKTSSDAREWENGVPAGYRAQTLWYMSAFGLDHAIVAVLIDDHDYREYRIDADPEEIARNEAGVIEFWNKLDDPPAASTTKAVKGIPKDKKKVDQYIREAADYRQEDVATTRKRFEELSDRDTMQNAIEKLYREHDPSTRTKNTVFVDLETNDTGRIIEIGITERDPQGNVVSVTDRLFSIPEEILEIRGTGFQDVHNITPDDIRDKPRFEDPEVQREIKSALEGRVLSAHNAPFEIGKLSVLLDDFVEMDLPVVDTMKLSKMFVPDSADNKLETLAAHLGVTYDNGHRALHDANVAADAEYILSRSIYRP